MLFSHFAHSGKGWCILFCLQDGVSPLYAASGEGHTDVVDILIKAGADIHQATEVCIISAITVEISSG